MVPVLYILAVYAMTRGIAVIDFAVGLLGLERRRVWKAALDSDPVFAVFAFGVVVATWPFSPSLRDSQE